MPKPQQRQPDDLSRSLTSVNMDATLIVVIEMSQSSWLVAEIVPGHRAPAIEEDEARDGLSCWRCSRHRWPRRSGERRGARSLRIAVAFEAGRDGFWLARWLRARGVEAHVIHASSIWMRSLTDEQGIHKGRGCRPRKPAFLTAPSHRIQTSLRPKVSLRSRRRL